MKVFLSSTCYDLIDLRAEVVNHLREQGISVMASDDMQSDFLVHPDRNSIETCLANVRACDHFVIVLDQRYGRILKTFGHDVSATHLEYKEAVIQDKPIHLFARDRLVADYTIWKRNMENPPELSWIRTNADQKIFELLKEHESRSRDKSNWFSIFTNSLDLKSTLSGRFRKVITPQRLSDLLNRNQFPVLDLVFGFMQHKASLGDEGGMLINLVLHNRGISPAFNLLLKNVYFSKFGSAEEELHSSSVSPFYKDSNHPIDVLFPYEIMEREDHELVGRYMLKCEYDTVFGVHVSDSFSFILKISNEGKKHRTTLESREYSYGDPIRIEIKEPSEQTSSDSLDQLPFS
jgi:hypothetical protein